MTTYKIKVDYENNAEEFWAALADHGGGSFSEPINALLRDEEIVVNAEQRDQLLSHFRTIPGWADPEAPAYARHPVIVTEESAEALP